MNTAQHAGRILNAWKTADHAALADALTNAQRSCRGVRSVNRLENEKQEVLESVIRTLAGFRPAGNGACAIRSRRFTGASLVRFSRSEYLSRGARILHSKKLDFRTKCTK